MSDSSTEKGIAPLMEEIHNIQRQLSDLNSRLSRGPKMLKVQEDAANNVLAKLEKVRSEYHQLQQAARFKEEQLTQSENALKRRREQMQEAKNNKEFQALKLQIQADEAANGVLADETLESLEKAEKFAPNVAAVEADLQAIKDLLEKTASTIAEEKPVIEADIARCSERLSAAEQKIPKEFREIYTRMTRTMGGEQGMAKISEGNYCGGCRQLIPINFVAQVIQGKPITCKSCGRLLYVPEGFSVK